jgi:hypothetical protein
MMALRACRKLMSAIQAASEELDDENNDQEEEPFTLADEDKVMTHMMDCVALLAAMQREEQKLDIPANLADTRVARNKVFMGALSIVGCSLLKIDEKEQRNLTANAAVDQLMTAFPVPKAAYLVQWGHKS